jgi:Ca2+-binding EF-hand superfamily protein
MELNEEQKAALRKLYDGYDEGRKEYLTPEEMDGLLLNLGIDESMAPALSRVLNKAPQGVTFPNVLDFCNVLVSGNLRRFWRFLLSGMDFGRDGVLDKHDLMAFARLMNDELSENEATWIIDEWKADDGSIRFESFWKWFRSEHGIAPGEEEEDALDEDADENPWFSGSP